MKLSSRLKIIRFPGLGKETINDLSFHFFTIGWRNRWNSDWSELSLSLLNYVPRQRYGDWGKFTSAQFEIDTILLGIFTSRIHFDFSYILKNLCYIQDQSVKMATNTREWSVEKSSVDLRDLQSTTMALSRADGGQVNEILSMFF